MNKLVILLLLSFSLFSIEIRLDRNIRTHRSEIYELFNSHFNSYGEGIKNLLNRRVHIKKKNQIDNGPLKIGTSFNRTKVLLIEENYLNEVYESRDLEKLDILFAFLLDSIEKYNEEPAFQEIGWWKTRGFLRRHQSRREISNISQRARAREFEFQNRRMTFAVNFHLFLRDSEFKCRRPLMYDYLSIALGVTPYNEVLCENFVSGIFQAADTARGLPFALLNINPERVYGIHYVWGSPGSSMAGRFGHSMFRIIVCRGERELGPACLFDESNHVMINFAANVDDLSLNSIKGLMGEYPSMLFAENFASTRDRYTKRQLQDMYSIPLNLNRDQINKFIKRAIQIHWAYRGEYKFLTNNCTTESLNLVKAIFPEREDVQRSHAIRPRRLISLFNELEIADTSVIEDLDEAERNGYFFKSEEVKYYQALSIINSQTNSSYENLDAYYASSAHERRELFNNTPMTRDLARSFWILERYLRLRIHHHSWIGEVVNTFETENQEEEFLDIMEETIKVIAGLQEPSFFLYPDSGYGIPHMNSLNLNPQSSNQADVDSTISRIRQDNGGIVSSLVSELHLTEENVDYFRERLLINDNL